MTEKSDEEEQEEAIEEGIDPKGHFFELAVCTGIFDFGFLNRSIRPIIAQCADNHFTDSDGNRTKWIWNGNAKIMSYAQMHLQCFKHMHVPMSIGCRNKAFMTAKAIKSIDFVWCVESEPLNEDTLRWWFLWHKEKKSNRHTCLSDRISFVSVCALLLPASNLLSNHLNYKYLHCRYIECTYLWKVHTDYFVTLTIC